MVGILFTRESWWYCDGFYDKAVRFKYEMCIRGVLLNVCTKVILNTSIFAMNFYVEQVCISVSNWFLIHIIIALESELYKDSCWVLRVINIRRRHNRLLHVAISLSNDWSAQMPWVTFCYSHFAF